MRRLEAEVVRGRGAPLLGEGRQTQMGRGGGGGGAWHGRALEAAASGGGGARLRPLFCFPF